MNELEMEAWDAAEAMLADDPDFVPCGNPTGCMDEERDTPCAACVERYIEQMETP